MRDKPEDHCWGDNCGPFRGFADSCSCNCPPCRKADADLIKKQQERWERERPMMYEPPPKEFFFAITSDHANPDDLDMMRSKANAVYIPEEEFLKACGGDLEPIIRDFETMPGGFNRARAGFYKSSFEGAVCYYVLYDGRYYIWVKEPSKIREKSTAVKRPAEISSSQKVKHKEFERAVVDHFLELREPFKSLKPEGTNYLYELGELVIREDGIYGTILGVYPHRSAPGYCYDVAWHTGNTVRDFDTKANFEPVFLCSACKKFAPWSEGEDDGREICDHCASARVERQKSLINHGWVDVGNQEPVIFINTYPDEDYPTRILEAHLANNTGSYMTDNLEGKEPTNPMIVLMNRIAVERVAVLRKAIGILQKSD